MPASGLRPNSIPRVPAADRLDAQDAQPPVRGRRRGFRRPALWRTCRWGLALCGLALWQAGCAGRPSVRPPAPEPPLAPTGPTAEADSLWPEEIVPPAQADADHADPAGEEAVELENEGESLAGDGLGELPAATLGVLAPFSGRYASYGNAYLDGARLAIESVPGASARLELLTGDSQGDPFVALDATRALLQRPEVVITLGGLLNLPTLVACVEANAQSMPFYSNVASEERIGNIGPYVFHEVPSGRSEGEAVAEEVLLHLRSFRAAVLLPEFGEARTLGEAFSQRFTDLGGQIVFSETYPSATTDFTPIVRRLRRADPDVVYLPVEVEDAMLIVPSLAFHGVTARLVGAEGWYVDRLLQAIHLDLEGALIPARLISGSNAELGDFRLLYRERFASEDNRFAAAGFVAARHVMRALRAIEPDALGEDGRPSREDVRASLDRLLLQEGPRRGQRKYWTVRNGVFAGWPGR